MSCTVQEKKFIDQELLKDQNKNFRALHNIFGLLKKDNDTFPDLVKPAILTWENINWIKRQLLAIYRWIEWIDIANKTFKNDLLSMIWEEVNKFVFEDQWKVDQRAVDNYYRFIDDTSTWSFGRFLDIYWSSKGIAQSIKEKLLYPNENLWTYVPLTLLTDWNHFDKDNKFVPDDFNNENNSYFASYGDPNTDPDTRVETYYDLHNIYGIVRPFINSKRVRAFAYSGAMTFASWLWKFVRTIWQFWSIWLYAASTMPLSFANILALNIQYKWIDWDDINKMVSRYRLYKQWGNVIDRLKVRWKDVRINSVLILKSNAWIQNILADTVFNRALQRIAVAHAIMVVPDSLNDFSPDIQGRFLEEYNREYDKLLGKVKSDWTSLYWLTHMVLGIHNFFNSRWRNMVTNVIKTWYYWTLWSLRIWRKLLSWWKATYSDYRSVAEMFWMVQYMTILFHMSRKISRQLWVECKDEQWNPIVWNCYYYKASQYFWNISKHITWFMTVPIWREAVNLYDYRNIIGTEWKITMEQYIDRAIRRIFTNILDIPKALKWTTEAFLQADKSDTDNLLWLFSIIAQWFQRYENYMLADPYDVWYDFSRWAVYDNVVEASRNILFGIRPYPEVDNFKNRKYRTDEPTDWNFLQWLTANTIKPLQLFLEYAGDNDTWELKDTLERLVADPWHHSLLKWNIPQWLVYEANQGFYDTALSSLLEYSIWYYDKDWTRNRSTSISYKLFTEFDPQWISIRWWKAIDNNKYSNRLEAYLWYMKKEYPDIANEMDIIFSKVWPSNEKEAIEKLILDWLGKVDPKVAIWFSVMKDMKDFMIQNKLYEIKWTGKYATVYYQNPDDPKIKSALAKYIVDKRWDTLFHTDQPTWTKLHGMYLRANHQELEPYISKYWDLKYSESKAELDNDKLESQYTIKESAINRMLKSFESNMWVHYAVSKWLERPDLLQNALTYWARSIATKWVDPRKSFEEQQKQVINNMTDAVSLLTLWDYTDVERSYMTAQIFNSSQWTLMKMMFENPKLVSSRVWEWWDDKVQTIKRYIYEEYGKMKEYDDVFKNSQDIQDIMKDVYWTDAPWSSYWDSNSYNKYKSSYKKWTNYAKNFVKPVYLKDIYPNYKSLYLPKIYSLSPKETQYIYGRNQYANNQARLNFTRFEKQWSSWVRQWQFWWRSSWGKYRRTKYRRTKYKSGKSSFSKRS